MVAHIQSSRKARFKAALARVGMTMREWAEQQDVGYTHLYLTLKDPTQSLSLTAKIDAFVDEIEAKAKEAIA
jgi:predicted transcriptional regulator